ncbi:methyltransferase FkbM family [Rhodopirellula sp. SWK7]|nr:methyltransferase FkbM family [Rhodopirellula sp. SWK7]
MVTVDHYCESNNIDSIDLLKIDAQGYDLQVLNGARRMLTNGKIKLFCCEANFDQMYEGQATLIDLLTFGDALGYRLVGFYAISYSNDRLTYLDMLFQAGN